MSVNPIKRSIAVNEEGKKKLRCAQKTIADKKISQSKIAEKAYVDLSTVKRFFNGTAIDIGNAESICKVLKLRLEDVIAIKVITSNTNLELVQNLSNNYREIFKKEFDEKCKQLTTNPLTAHCGSQFDLDDVYVDLELVEVISESKHQDTESYMYGSTLSKPTEQGTGKDFKNHDDFLTTVLEQKDTPKSQGKRIAIIGEPGAGKTTRLQKIGQWIFKNINEGVAIWISLADLKNKTLEDYLINIWFKNTLNLVRVTPELENALVEIFNSGKVHLLLDGIDELGNNNYLSQIHSYLQGWINKATIITTCRTNVWNAKRNDLYYFDVYENLDLNNDQRKRFIYDWFSSQEELAKNLNGELDKSENREIKDLVKNPLRLTLLCSSWQRRQGKLPDTKVGLYKYFVDEFYSWKEWDWEHFNSKSEAQYELNKILGKLARQVIDNSVYHFHMTHNQVCQIFEHNSISLSLFDLSLNIGWIQHIGYTAENPDEKVYSFFHTTFQEYFAALAIDDWDYFLPRNHDNQTLKPITGRKYRAFEEKWKSIILLWLENGIVKNYNSDDIEDFLRYLERFKDGIVSGKPFYKFQLLEFLSTILNKIKYTSTYFHEVTRFHVDEFGCVDYDSKELDVYYYLMSISQLIETSDNYHQKSSFRLLLDKLNISKEDYPKTIPEGIDINKPNIFGFTWLEFSYNFHQDPDLISEIFDKFNAKYNLNFELEEKYYANLLELMLSNKDKEYIILGGYYCLLKLNNIEKNINIIKYFVQDSNLPFYSLAYQYSKQISYEIFYNIWHSNSLIVQNLEAQLYNTSIQVNITNKTYSIIIDLKSLVKEIDTRAISQEFCNQIYQIAFPKLSEIPEVNNAQQLKRLVPQIKNDLNKQNLALILQGEDPYPELEKFCRQLSNAVNIAWITEKPLEQPLRGFPCQPNLTGILQNWIDEII